MTQPTAGNELVVRTSQLDELARLGTWLAALEGGSHDPKSLGAAAALRFYYAQQLDLPATAVAEMTVINGRVFMGAQLLRALAERRGYRVIRKDASDETCTAVLLNAAGEVLGEATFTMEQAKHAGLVRERSPWKTHPGRMLWARASTNVIRDFAPAVSLGIGEESEIVEYTGQTTAPDDDEEIPWEPSEREVEEELEKQGAVKVTSTFIPPVDVQETIGD